MKRIFFALLVTLCVAPCFSQTSATPLVQGPAARIAPIDVEADAQRIPPEARATAFSVPANLRQEAQNLFVRRALAAEAKAQKLDQPPLAAATVQLALDRALSDLYLAELDRRNEPDAKAIADYALAQYKSDPARFQIPAETRARHILIRGATPEAKARAEQLLERIKSGADFAALAKESSEDPGSAAKGGDLGYFGKGRMVKPFEDAVDALKKPGDVSGLVETQFGYHIIQLTDRHEAGTRPYDEVKETLEQQARAAILSEARMREVKTLLEKAQFNDAAIQALAESFTKQP